jgi:hypothetical protein
MKRFNIIEPVHSPVFTNVSSHRVTFPENILDILFKHQGEAHKKLIFELPNIPYINNQSFKPTLKLIITNNKKAPNYES